MVLIYWFPQLSPEEEILVETQETIQGRLAGIWADVLDVPRVEMDDDFFALGGDSILVTIMAMRVEQAFDVVIDPGCIFDSPTLGAFALEVAAAH